MFKFIIILVILSWGKEDVTFLSCKVRQLVMFWRHCHDS